MDVIVLMAVDPTRCPLCGGPNDCGVAAGKGVCWCFSATVRSDVIERVPEELRGAACVCSTCATGRTAESPTHVPKAAGESVD